jgi:hypothetical protein
MAQREFCGAKRLGGEGTCRNPPGYRTPHEGRGPCWQHFGCTPSVTTKYIVEEAMENCYAAGFSGNAIDIGPHDALLEEVRRTAGRVRYIENMLNFKDMEDVEQAAFEQQFTKERAHLVTVCGVAARAGVEERAVALAEAWGHELAAVMGRIFQEIGLTPEQREIAPAIVSRHLQMIEAG